MITKNVEYDGAKAVLRRNTHQGRIMTLYIREVFGELNPGFKDLYDQLLIKNLDDVLVGLSSAESRLFLYTLEFSGNVGCIIAASGFPYPWPALGTLPTREWVKEAFGHFMSYGPSDESIWSKIEEALDELMEPAGPKEQWPAEALSKEDLADPN